MKKSTLLSFATAAAIVVTSAGTYAAWDKTSVETTPAEVTISKNVDMTIENLTFTPADKTTIGEAVPEQTKDINVTVKDVPTTAKDNYKLETTATITDENGIAIDDNSITATATPENESLTGTANDIHKVTVKVTPQTTEAAGKTFKVTVKAELKPVDTTPAA